jgi:hypothetical protein
MKLASRLGWLVLAAVGCFAAQEYFLTAIGPPALADLSVQQMNNSDPAAGTLRVADGSKSWLASGWLPLAAVAVLAVYLFRDEIRHLLPAGEVEESRGPDS